MFIHQSRDPAKFLGAGTSRFNRTPATGGRPVVADATAFFGRFKMKW
jgi:hypothetical protein